MESSILHRNREDHPEESPLRGKQAALAEPRRVRQAGARCKGPYGKRLAGKGGEGGK
ncbi:hypothetical protein PMAA_049050 [Talaromyces marneffei ATCC 18224]|uniref:Uncharacterized protein n=1 Tax=Talaromyces marneffei (strain ATCC 18224 / CBS 334.59 / QM 7333) TaxID=441960 RepID=B6QRU0_TALMQ|nr:hypothetical protein PMAA_049050 [Talaromyces marneffei ATCC 18224]